MKDALRLHSESAVDLLRRAGAVPRDQWSRPLAAGKWTPAQVMEHLTLAYDVMLRELSGGPGMRVRTSPWLRLVLRWTVMPRLLRGGPFPKAHAPRETVPSGAAMDQTAAIEAFRSRAAQFEDAVQTAGRRVKLTHAYFGRMRLTDFVVLCARHIIHHGRQLGSGTFVP